ncbi:MAG: F0F1 ATP synthase subunit gamma [Alphaproteobacteria bacterium]
MPNLKELRNRIQSVKSTQKITSAMKMVAAAKLRRAQEQAEAARPFAERMERMLSSLSESLMGSVGAPTLMVGSGSDQVHLVIVATSDRGLCGGFNSSIVRDSRRLIAGLISQGKDVKILCVGRKGSTQLTRDYGSKIIDTIEDVGRQRLSFSEADGIAGRVLGMFDAGEFDVCTVVYNRFQSAMTQFVTRQQLIPFVPPEPAPDTEDKPAASTGGQAIYEFEPNEAELLADILPRNLAVQIFHALLENAASEQGSRMTAMDNATRNAGDMIDGLTLKYNRSRQASITSELIEIISGAEAV